MIIGNYYVNHHNGHKTNYWGVSDLKLVDSFISKDILKLTKVEDIQKRLQKRY